VEETLFKGLSAKEVWVGHDFSFGKGKRGTVEYLKELAGKFGFKVFVMPAYKKEGFLVSSSLVRELVKIGKVAEAAKFLGRPFSIKGTVVGGRNVAKALGFPTANISTGNELLPARGVYAVRVVMEGRPYKGVSNIGVAPTFRRKKPAVEVHMLDFSGRIYGKSIEVAFIEKIRNEMRFQGAEELSKRIEKDVRAARVMLFREDNR
jgi:riboflavin kinase/FMN adenylyltransferase